MAQTLSLVPTIWLAIVLLAVLGFIGFFIGRARAVTLLETGDGTPLNSRANFHGYFVGMWTLLPALIVLLVYGIFGGAVADWLLVRELPSGFVDLDGEARAEYLKRVSDFTRLEAAPETGDALFNAVAGRFSELTGQVKLGALGLALIGGLAGLVVARARLHHDFRARLKVEGGIQTLLLICAGVAIATTIGIVLSLIFEAFRFFGYVNPLEFLFGTQWSAQSGEPQYGAVPLFFGTMVISLIAMLVAVPVGLYAAIFLSEYAGPRTRAWAKPVLEVLAGIPTVVYGFFAVLLIAPIVRMAALGVNDLLMMLPFITGPVLDAQPTSALAAGLVMGVMIIPFVSSLSDDVINSVPQSLRDGAFAIGATRSETIKQVVLPAALPGIIAAIMLAVSRAIGETMIVVMAAGQRAQITPDVTSDITTITATIVALLTGDSEYGSPKVLSAFALGFVLFLVTLLFNLIAIRVVARFRERYD